MTLPKMAPATIFKLFAAFLFAAFLGMASMPARADEAPLPPDTVTLSLAAEGWVDAAAARVTVAVDSALPGEQAGSLRAKVKSTLATLLPGAEWHVTSLDRSRDQTGLERWHLEAEARADETALDGLYDRAKSQSKPGAQVTVTAIDFTPKLAEREAVMADLRAKIYAAAKDELARLTSVYPDRAFRLRDVTFVQGPMPMAAYKASPPAQAMMSAEAARSSAGIGVAEHIELSANVVLAAEAPKPKKE